MNPPATVRPSTEEAKCSIARIRHPGVYWQRAERLEIVGISSQAKLRSTRLTNRTLFITTPSGVIFTVEPQHTEAIAECLTRFLPAYAVGHVANGDYWLVTPKYAETVRVIVLVTTGEMLRLWAESYPAALARLAGYGRGVKTLAVAA